MSSLTRTQNTVRAAGFDDDDDDAADDVLPQTLIFLQPSSVYPKLKNVA
ncbi:hypothetical protein A2U01_0105371 [Trifolium medium]|uniref:Uncharacterized protein n=1 Tax=Trifolium medium TaxID=97028 RepID=A0A392VB61_9FABA|nr:hypothetical protein [Trifolium medium]